MKTTNWEKEFDNTFDLDNYGGSHIMNRKVKEFISIILQEEKEKLLNDYSDWRHKKEQEFNY